MEKPAHRKWAVMKDGVPCSPSAPPLLRRCLTWNQIEVKITAMARGAVGHGSVSVSPDPAASVGHATAWELVMLSLPWEVASLQNLSARRMSLVQAPLQPSMPEAVVLAQPRKFLLLLYIPGQLMTFPKHLWYVSSRHHADAMGKDMNKTTPSPPRSTLRAARREAEGRCLRLICPTLGKTLHAIPVGEWCILGTIWSFKMISADSHEVESLWLKSYARWTVWSQETWETEEAVARHKLEPGSSSYLPSRRPGSWLPAVRFWEQTTGNLDSACSIIADTLGKVWGLRTKIQIAHRSIKEIIKLPNT